MACVMAGHDEGDWAWTEDDKFRISSAMDFRCRRALSGGSVSKISFVITVFNKAPFLPAVIKGLKQQTGPFEREFIFIDDGSRDDSVAVIQRETAGLENVRIVAQENHGPAIATNNAVSVATGDWIKLVDSDDVLAPFCSRVLLERAVANDLDFIFGSAAYYDMNVGPVFDETGLDKQETIIFNDPLLTVLDRGFARVSHCLFRRDAFVRAGGCDPRIFSQDHSLFIRLSAIGKLGQVKHVVCLGPEDEPGRIMNNQAQVIHDASIALALFAKDHPELDAGKYRIIARKVLSRVRKWEKKELGKGNFGPGGCAYLLSRIGLVPSADKLVSLCRAFEDDQTVRIPNKTTLPELKEIAHEL